MNKPSHSFHFVLALFEHANFIGDRALTQLVDAQGEIDNGWEFDGSQVGAVRIYDEANLRRRRWVQCAVLDEVRVDDRIEEVVVNAIIEVVVPTISLLSMSIGAGYGERRLTCHCRSSASCTRVETCSRCDDAPSMPPKPCCRIAVNWAVL